MLKGKCVLITGASSGLGMHFAKLCASEGADAVVLAARRVDRIAQLSKDLSTSGVKVLPVEMDVNSTASIRNGFDSIQSKVGRTANVIINNAGISRSGHLLNVSEKDYDDIMATNLKGAFFVAQEGAKRMVQNKEKSGSIINIASILGLRVGKDLGVYAMSKAGVVQMTKAMALEFIRYNIRVNAICPGYFKTEMNDDFFDSAAGKKYVQEKIPAKRIGQEHELDGAVLMLSSDERSSFITGSIISIDGGHLLSSL